MCDNYVVFLQPESIRGVYLYDTRNCNVERPHRLRSHGLHANPNVAMLDHTFNDLLRAGIDFSCFTSLDDAEHHFTNGVFRPASQVPALDSIDTRYQRVHDIFVGRGLRARPDIPDVSSPPPPSSSSVLVLETPPTDTPFDIFATTARSDNNATDSSNSGSCSEEDPLPHTPNSGRFSDSCLSDYEFYYGREEDDPRVVVDTTRVFAHVEFDLSAQQCPFPHLLDNATTDEFGRTLPAHRPHQRTTSLRALDAARFFVNRRLADLQNNNPIFPLDSLPDTSAARTPSELPGTTTDEFAAEYSPVPIYDHLFRTNDSLFTSATFLAYCTCATDTSVTCLAHTLLLADPRHPADNVELIRNNRRLLRRATSTTSQTDNGDQDQSDRAHAPTRRR